MMKKDKNEEVVENITTEEVNTDATTTTDESDVPASKKVAKEEKKKNKKTRKLTVEEILAGDNNLEEFDEYGRPKKIKVKMKTASKLKKREARMGYFFIFPWLIGAVGLLAYPLITSIVYSFSKIRLINGVTAEFNGFVNFQQVFTLKKLLLVDLGQTIIKLAMSVPMIVVFALLMAIILNMKLKARGLYRTIFFLPVIIVSGPVMAMLTAETSDIEAVDLTAIQAGLDSALPVFMASALGYVFSNIIMLLWYGGVQILIFLAALQKIDTSLYEAAKIDGGSSWECFWKITLPTIKPMIMLNALYTLIFLAQDTNVTPLINDIKNTMTSSRSNAYGFGSAYAVIYSVVIIILVIVVGLLFRNKKDVYMKQVAKTKKLERKTRKSIAKSQRKAKRNEKRFEKQLQKSKKIKDKDVILKGGRFDE